MKKLFIALGLVTLLAAGCQSNQNKDTSNNGITAEAEIPNQNSNEAQVDTANWKNVDLPETLVGVSYPQDWTLTNKSKELVELSNGNGKINIFYKLDPSFIDQTAYPPKSESEIKKEYVATLKNIISRNTTTKYRDGNETESIEVLNNGQKEIHNIFFVGTVIVDVYTESLGSSIYAEIVKNIKYRGF